jgi:hypothetical protein
MGSLADSSLGFRNIINPDRPLRACTVAIALATAGTMAEVAGTELKRLTKLLFWDGLLAEVYCPLAKTDRAISDLATLRNARLPRYALPSYALGMEV